MKNNIKKIFTYLQKNQRYFWVFLVLFLTFLLNRSFPAETITSKDCVDEDCQITLEKPSLSKNDSKFFVNDIFSSEKNSFYRLIFEAQSNQETALEVFATNPLDEDKKIQSIEMEGSGKKQIFEMIIKTDEKKYSDLLFQKSDSKNQAEIFISQIILSKLNIQNESELENLQKTIIGGANLEIKDQEQTKNEHRFTQLKENDVLFGQIFRPNLNFLTGIELDLDIIKQSNNGGKKYALEVREIKFKSSDVPEIKSHPISVFKFSLNDLEHYRKENGKFLFPILAKLEKDKSYFFGINNDRVEVDEFNHLLPKGTQESSSYTQGSLATKYKKYSYLAQGDLYFKTFGFELKKYESINVLPGSIIEDRGKNQTFFSYHYLGNQFEMINLESHSEDIFFDKNKKSLTGEMDEKNPSFFVYHFQTVHSFKNFTFKASEGNATWNSAKVSYSFDKKNWSEIPEEVLKDNSFETQTFNFEGQTPISKNEIYFKIEPQKNKYPNQKKYGLKNIFFQAELIDK